MKFKVSVCISKIHVMKNAGYFFIVFLLYDATHDCNISHTLLYCIISGEQRRRGTGAAQRFSGVLSG